MNVKSQIVILCLVICILMSVCTVSANDVNDTYLAVEDSVIDENITIDESQELLQVNENEDMLSADEGSFAELQNLINENSGTLTLNKSYVFNDGDNPISITKPISINGNGYKIDGAGKSSILKITGNDVTLKNIEFSNGYINSPDEVYGAAIIWEGNNGIVNNCIFSNNTIRTEYYEESKGGAIYWNGINATINGSTFKNNSILDTAGDGGAIFFTSKCVNVFIDNSHFIDNNAYSEGGAIYILNDKSRIINSSFKNNYAAKTGGAIYYSNNREGRDVVISKCDFVDNIADTGVYGSAIYADSINSTIYKCNFTGVNPIRLESRPKSGIINISGNIEKGYLQKNHIIYNNARLWLENNSFNTTIYNEQGLILSHVTSYVLDSSHSYGKSYYEWNAIDKFLYKVTILDDNNNKIINREITLLDTKEGLITTDNNFTYCNFNNSYMWFVGVHILSVIWDKKYFADMDNKTTNYRVNGSYAHLQYFNWAYDKTKDKGSWDYDGGDVILEGNIEYSPTFDTSSVAIEKMKSIGQKYDFINGVEIEISFKGSLWNNGGKVRISGNGSALGIDIGSDNVYIENIRFNNHFDYDVRRNGISFTSYHNNITINNCEFSGNYYNKTRQFTGIDTAYGVSDLNIFTGIYIYSESDDFSIMNCKFNVNRNDNASCINLKGNNVKIINNTFSDSFAWSAGDKSYSVTSLSVGGCLIYAESSNNYLLENNTFGDTEMNDCFDEYGLIFNGIDNLTIKNMKITNIIDKSFLTIYNSENIYIDNLNITADDMRFYEFIPKAGSGYRCIPEALVVIGLYSGSNKVIENLTIVNSEFSKSYTTCLYIKEHNVQDAVININMSNIYCHDNNRLSPAYYNEPDSAGNDVFYYDHNFTVSDPDVFFSVDSVVNMDNSRFERLKNGVAVWAVGALTVNNCSFIDNKGYFTGYEGGIRLSNVYDYEYPQAWYGENGAAIAASNYLAVYNSTFIIILIHTCLP